MQKTYLLLAAAMSASFALAACNSEPEQINKFDAQAEELKKAPPVAPPPMITASRTFRCRDNSLFYVDFFNNNSAIRRTEPGGDPVAALNAASADGPFTGQDYSVSANAENVTISAPGKGSQSCHT